MFVGIYVFPPTWQQNGGQGLTLQGTDNLDIREYTDMVVGCVQVEFREFSIGSGTYGSPNDASATDGGGRPLGNFFHHGVRSGRRIGRR